MVTTRYDLGCIAKNWDWAACTGCWLPNSLSTFAKVSLSLSMFAKVSLIHGKNEFCSGYGFFGKKIGGKFGLKSPKIAKFWPKNGLIWPKNGLKWP